MRPYRYHATARSHRWATALIVIAVLVTLVPARDPIAAQRLASPTATFPVEAFTGPDFVDFWWDPTDIPLCDAFSVWRKTDSTPYVLVGTPACGAGLFTDSTASPGITYQYQLSVQDGAQPPVTQYTVFRSATPGQVGGTLHRSLSLSGALTISAISVAADGTLTLSNATVTGGTIYDWAGSPPEQGTVVVSGGTFDGTTFGLTDVASTITGGSFTSAVVGTHADVTDATFDDTALGFEGDGGVSLSGSTFVGSLVSVSAANADIGSNDFLSSTLSIRGTTTADVYDNAFGDSALRVWEQAGVIASTNTFTGTIPDTLAFIDVTTDAGITIDSNTLAASNASGLRPAIRIQPAVTPSEPASFTLRDNVLTGRDAGLGIQVLTNCGETVPNVQITDNAVARFTRAIDLSNQICPGGAIGAVIGGNTLTSNGYAIYDDVHGAESTVVATNNCIAGNTTAGVWCSNVGNVFDATSNYWGHSTGPTHLTNPDGLGDRISCSDAATEIDFAPWLESHACTISGLVIAKTEVVQTVQTISNTIALVAGKPTVVRVYPDLDIGYATVDGTLTGTRDGVTLGTIQARSPIQVGSITDWEAARTDASTSLVFELPQDWPSGVVALRAELTTDSAAAQGIGSDLPTIRQSLEAPVAAETACLLTDTAVATTTAVFNERRPVKIAYIPASIDRLLDYHPVTAKDILAIHQRILAQFPFGEATFRIMPAIDRYVGSGGMTLPGHYFAYVSGVARRWDIINNPDDVADYYVTVYGTDSTDYTGSWFFLGDPSGATACGLRYEGRDCLVSIGNVLGLRPLIIGREEAMPPFDYAFPYADGLTHEVGYDVPSGEVQSPGLYDLMAPEALNGAPSWISDFHYEKVYLNLAPASGALATSASAAGDYLYVSGLVGPTDGRFYPVVHLGNSPEPDDVTPVDPAGAYCLEARDMQYHVLESKCFHVDLTNVATGTEDPWAAFTASLTADPAIRQLQLRYNGAVVKQLVVPSTAPAVTLVSAGYDATYRSAQIAWTTPLEDAPGLRYHVHYSADDGATWIPVAIDLSPASVQTFDGALHWGVRAAQIPDGSQARLRLIASDGFNETTVTSGAFVVPDVGPWLEITAPADNAVIDTFPVVLEGYAYDSENGDRTAAMTWSSDRDGPLGTGDSVSVSGLSPGSHVLTLAADDGDGHVGTDTIHVTVNGTVVYTSWVYLPLALR